MIARIGIDAEDVSLRGRVPDSCFTLTVEQSEHNWRLNFVDETTLNLDGEHLVVAEVDGVVVGRALAGRASRLVAPEPIASRFPRDLTALHVDPSHHGRGIGRRLVEHVAGLLHDEGVDGLLVRTLAPNPYKVFYERMGAELIGSRPYDLEGYQTEELLYGWDDLAALAARGE